jgi:4-amino-4-deoxy-L-arabinose transferase-like glycosyltransferase
VLEELPANDSRPNTWLWLFVAVGITLRLVRYAVDMPVWGDEASLALNILNRGYSGLLRPLDYYQVAPIGFLWSERAIYEHLGMSEYAMRLLPMAAGVAALVLFACWSRLLLSPWAAAAATGILAVGNFCVRYAVELKPYGFDLLAGLLLLLPATLFILRRRTRWLILLIVLTPAALALSYPAIFVAGGAALGLLVISRKMSASQIVLFITFCLVLAGSFYVEAWIGAGQYRQTQTAMTTYWKGAFPPANPLRLAWWLILIHTGNMFEYPVGGANGASTASFLVFLVGIFGWLRHRKRTLIWLMLGPFALNFLAAALRRYPYGESARVAQPLAPAIILLIGAGSAVLMEKLIHTPKNRRLAQGIFFAALLLLGGGVLAQTVIHPYKSIDDAEGRAAVRQLFSRAGPGDVIVVLAPRDQVHVTLQWYLREQNGRIVWDGQVDRSWMRGDGRIWVLNLAPDPGIDQRLAAELGRPVVFQEVRQATHDLDTVPLRYWQLIGFAARSKG